MIICFVKLLQDSKMAYECLKYFTPITKDWMLIKYDPNYRQKAEKVFAIGKVPISVEQCLKNWEIIEQRYYETHKVFLPESAEENEDVLEKSIRSLKIFSLELFVKIWLCCDAKFKNYWETKSKYKDEIKNYWLPKLPKFLKSSSTLSKEVYPPVGWYLKVKEEKIEDEIIEERYIEEFRKRLEYEESERIRKGNVRVVKKDLSFLNGDRFRHEWKEWKDFFMNNPVS